MIELYKIRTFSDKLSDTIDFIRENWRPLLKNFTYVMLPASIVLAFFFNHFWHGYMSLMNPSQIGEGFVGTFMLNSGMTILLFIVAYILLAALLYALIRLYREREGRLNDLTSDELKPQFMACLKRAATIAGMGLLLGIGVLAVIAIIGVAFGTASAGLAVLFIVLCYIALLIIVPPLMLLHPIYLIEDGIGFFPALTKALRLGFHTWGGIVGVTFVIGLLTSILQIATSLPWDVMFIIKTVFTVSTDLEGGFVNSFGFTVLEYLSCILQVMGMLFSTVITTIAITIQYGHAAELIDGMGTTESIEHFEELDN